MLDKIESHLKAHSVRPSDIYWPKLFLQCMFFSISYPMQLHSNSDAIQTFTMLHN